MTYYSFIKPYRSKIIIILFLILVTNLLSLALPWGIKIIIDHVLVHKNTRLLNLIILGLVGVLIFQMVFNYLRKTMSYVIGEKIVCDLREKIYWHIQKMSLSRIKEITPPQILTRFTGDVESVRRFIFNDAIECVYAVLSLGFIIAVLLWINPRLTLVALLTLPLFGLMYFGLVPRLKEGYCHLRDANSRLVSRISEILNGITVVRVFTAESQEKEYFLRKQKEIYNIAKNNHALNVGLWTGIDFFTSIGIISLLWIGGLDVIQQRMTPGALIAFYSYLGMLFTPLIRLVVINGSYQEANASLNRINAIMKGTDDVPQRQSPVFPPSFKGGIEFRNVSFSYSKGEEVLKDISFSVTPGETIGIVGPSGSGKTTLVHLLIRFFDPQRGEIRIDGHDLRNMDLKAFRQNLAVVLQDDYLFSGTIQDNICYPEALSDHFDAPLEQMRAAARIARADDFIQEFKDGYMTQAGDRGTHLSSGQRQRIAIARALRRQPSVLILDEATSAVDAMTENEIQKAIRQQMKDKTVIIVAHRFSSIIEADKIIVLDNKRIVEIGDHHELLKRHGFYSHLYLEQFKENDKYSFAVTQE